MKDNTIPAETKVDETNIVTKVFGWVAAGLFVSGIVAFKLFQNYNLVQVIMENFIVFCFLALVHLGVVIWLSINIEKIDSSQITLFFFGFAVINGLMLPLIFQFFTQNFMISTFFILSAMFLVISIFGYFTKSDLTSWEYLILMLLVGVIIDILINLVWKNDRYQLITSAIAIAVFVGILAYDSKRIKEMNKNDIPHKVIIRGALTLSLDFYYLFIAIILAVNKRDKKSSL